MLNVSYVGAVWVDVVNDAVAVVAGVTLIWWNVERAMQAREERKKRGGLITRSSTVLISLAVAI